MKLELPPAPDLDAALDRVRRVALHEVRGHVVAATSATVTAVLPDAAIGQIVKIQRRDRPLRAEVSALRDGRAHLVPHDSPAGVRIFDPVQPEAPQATLRVGSGWLGRVVDGLGRPLDGQPEPDGTAWPLHRPPPDPFSRRRVDRPLSVGVRAIDGLCTLGRGQRIGLFAGAGVGKTTLSNLIAARTEADVVVRCSIGERGREVRDLVEHGRSPRTVLVAATADRSPLERRNAPFVATTIAEWFREQGQDVLLLVDSLTRLARAQRELGLELGEAPTRHGYPPSVFTLFPRLLERAGPSSRGAITAIYTVLVAGDDPTEPIADEARSLLDGHVHLDRARAERGIWPAIDVLRSLSRVMNDVVEPAHSERARTIRRALGLAEAHRDLVALGADESSLDPTALRALALEPEIEAFVAQGVDDPSPWQDTLQSLSALAEAACAP